MNPGGDRTHGSGLPTPLARALALLALCYAAAALATQVVLASRFRHDPAFVASLGGVARWTWASTGLLLATLVLLDRIHRLRGQVLLDSRLLDRAGWGAALLGVLALSPFLSAYAIHVQIVACALIAAFSLGAALGLSRVSARIGSVLEHPASPWVAAALASLWYFALSYYRHAQFGSGSRDMGLFFQSVWLLSTGQAPLNTLIDVPSASGAVSAFADHMEWIDLLMVPLVWVWRDAGALLLGQALVAGSSVAAVMRLAQRRLQDGPSTWLLGACVFASYPLVQAVQFDFNPTCLAAGFLAWAFDLADQRRYRAMAVALLLVGLCKENLLLYVAAFGLTLAVEGHAPWLALSIMALALTAFVVELKLIFPLFREQGFRHFYFRSMGHSLGEVAVNVLASPLRAASQLLTPGNKINGLLLPFTSVAGLALAAPAVLLVALPGVGERFLGDFRNAWWGHHYGAPTAVVAVVAAVFGIERLAPRLRGRLGAVLAKVPAVRLLALSTVLATALVDMGGRWSAIDLFVLEKPYLPPKAERAAMRAAIASVPDAVAVAAQNHMVPHLAARSQIYELARIDRAEVAVLDRASSPWPYNARYIDDLARRLAADPAWRLSFCEAQAWVFVRAAHNRNEPACPALKSLVARREQRQNPDRSP